jgi:ferric-dicitrate binding protein FerR (iron transport regulator)
MFDVSPLGDVLSLRGVNRTDHDPAPRHLRARPAPARRLRARSGVLAVAAAGAGWLAGWLFLRAIGA